MTEPLLTKTRLLSGIQCPKRLYLEIHHPEFSRPDRTSIIQEFMGVQIGRAIKRLFPGGELIEDIDDISFCLDKTERLLRDIPDLPLFEATFAYSGVLVKSDVFVLGNEGYRLIEAKATTSVKEFFLLDCAIQAWIIEKSGYPIETVEVAYVNKDFIYQGDEDCQGLFKFEDFTEGIIPIKKRIHGWIERTKRVLRNDMPKIKMGPHCKTPYLCPFRGFCSPNQLEYPVSVLPCGGEIISELLSEGIRDIREIPEGRLEKPIHKRVHRVTLTGKPELDRAAGEYLKSLPYPRYYIDFETISFGSPVWIGTTPYQQIPFQWSCHMENEAGDLVHTNFLDISGALPIRPFIGSLLKSLGDSGPVFVYGIAFEKRILKELSEVFPDLSDKINAVIDRLVDLLPIARKYYYHPMMKGSWSLKSILPTIDSDMDYNNLEEIRCGIDAQVAYLEAIDPSTTKTRINELRDKLIDYCKMDTLGLVKMVNFFDPENAFKIVVKQ